MKLSVVIPTFNRQKCLYILLQQLLHQDLEYTELMVVVVVDGSNDGTLEMLETEFPRVHVVKGDGSWWWTRSINEGCKYALEREADAILLMNDDLEIQPYYIQTIVDAAESEPDAVIGSLNLSLEEPRIIFFSGVKKISWWNARSLRYHDKLEPYDKPLTGLHNSVVLMGRGTFIPKFVFQKIGMLDQQRFPQYKADLDFVLTAHEQGIKTLVSWDSVIYSRLELTGKGVTYKKQSLFAFLRSFFQPNTMTNLVHSFRYYRKHCPWYFLPLSYTLDKFRLIYSFLTSGNKI